MYHVIDGLELGFKALASAAVVALCAGLGAGLVFVIFSSDQAVKIGGMAGLIFGIGAVIGFWKEP